MRNSELDPAGGETVLPNLDSTMYMLGNKIREGRLRLELNAHQLAEVSGVPVSIIFLLEWHMCEDVDVLTIARLADALMTNLIEMTE